MQTVEIKCLNRTTSVLGFGCVGLTAVATTADAVALLQTAYDAGIRHFDVARVYGSGRAEGILGKFICGRRSEYTITTKFGLSPPRIGRLRGLIPLAKQAVKLIPRLERVAKSQAVRLTREQAFGVGDARRSLEDSLRELRTDYIDILLMHEATASDAEAAELLGFLEDQKRAGTIRAFGVGSAFAKMPDAAAFPSSFSVFQFDSNLFSPHASLFARRPDQSVIVFGALSPRRRCQELLKSRPELALRFKRETGIDINEPSLQAAMLLAWTMHHGHADLVLFGSTRPHNILANASVLEDDKFSPEVTRLFEKYLTEALTPSTHNGITPHDP